MTNPPEDRSSPHGKTGYWLLTSLCLVIIIAVGWAFYLEQTMMGRYLPLVAMTDPIKVGTPNAQLRFEEIQTSHITSLASLHLRRIRLAQLCLLGIGLTLVFLVGRIFKQLINARLVEVQKAKDQVGQQAIEMQEQILLLTLGAEVGVVLTKNDNLHKMLDACCTLLVTHLDAAFARVWIMQDDGSVLELQASAGMYTRIDGISRMKPVDDSNKIGFIALSRRPYISNQLVGDPQIVNQEWVLQEKMVAFAGHPLMIGDKVIGVLAMFSRSPLSKIVIRTLASIADSVALAIDNHKAVQSLQRSRERYRDLIENISDWIWKVDENFVYTYSSPQGSKMLGYDPQEIIGKTPFDFMAESESDRVRLALHDIIAHHLPIAGLENVNLHRDGHKVVLETSWVPIIDEQGHFRGYRGIDRDVTARKEAEIAVANQKKMLEAMFNAVPDAMILISTEHDIKMINYGFFELFGYAENEILGQKIRVLYERQADYERQGGLCLNTNKQTLPLPCEIEYRRKSGSVFPGETVGAEIKDGEGLTVGYLSLIRDISGRKQVEASLRHSQKMEALGTLSGGIAHDFNNLLNVISGFATLTLDDLEKDSLAARNLQEVVKASERAATLVRQILSFSKGAEEERRPLCLHHIAKEVVKLMAGTLPATIEIKQNIDNTCRSVLADASQIHQVLMNLCTNAYHAMRETGGILEIRLQEEEVGPGDGSGLPAGRYTKLSVLDTGHGMDQAVQSRIFEPYFTTKKVGEGTGLGLATVHGIIKSHGGRITVASEVGKGSIFTLYLPIIDQGLEPVIEKNAGGKLMLEQIKAHILFVDDVDFNVNLGVQLLGRVGCQVTGETDSTAALALFARGPQNFDLVITDQTMPKMTGIDMARQMLALRADIPIIMVTGHSDTVDEDTAKEAGIRAFLPKPLIIEQLVETIRNLLGQTGGKTALLAAPLMEAPREETRPDMAPAAAKLETVIAHLVQVHEVSEDMVDTMVASLQESLRSEMDKAKIAAGHSDMKALAMAAHAMKGILLNSGLSALAETARDIELSAKREDKKDYGGLLDDLGQGLAFLVE